jgi:predicted negative regulator of RcsB-dependent stress response
VRLGLGQPATVRPLALSRLGRTVAALLLLGTASCAYFNGIYNARDEEKKADRLARRGEEAAAQSAYLASAQKAETVLARHGKSRWRPSALYLAGRGAALGGDCPKGEARLREYLSTNAAAGRERDLASIALGACELGAGRLRDARERLMPLVSAKDKGVRSLASLWAARVAIRLGDTDGAARLLQSVNPGLAQWELASASLEAGNYARAESLLAQRAVRGDWREGALQILDQLWAAGQDSAALRLAKSWARAGTPVAAKVRMHLRIGDLAMGSGRDSLAGEHIREAQRLSTDAAIDRESAARLLIVRVAEADSLSQIDELLRQAQRLSGDSPVFVRLSANLLLVHMLSEYRRDSWGAGWFLAGEVVRDSLRNHRVAHRFFRLVADSAPDPLAPTALLAAALLSPDSADRYRERVRRDHADSPAAYLLAGRDAAELPAWRFIDEQLRSRWNFVGKLHRDSVARLQPTVPGTPPPSQAESRSGQFP